jgi:hypothetical protein
MNDAATVTTVAHVIQQAVAPVFLLTGIGAILNVTTNRLSRIVDRFRILTKGNESQQPAHTREMRTLSRRAKWVHRAVSLCTIAALLICIVVAALFVGAFINVDPSRAVALLFISAMLALIFGLLCFLREIWLATGTIELRKNTDDV